MKLDLEPKMCIRIISNDQNCNSGTWTGSPISLSRNDVVIDTLETGFEDYKYCLPMDQVDIENDIFDLRIQGDDGVSNSRSH